MHTNAYKGGGWVWTSPKIRILYAGFLKMYIVTFPINLCKMRFPQALKPAVSTSFNSDRPAFISLSWSAKIDKFASYA